MQRPLCPKRNEVCQSPGKHVKQETFNHVSECLRPQNAFSLQIHQLITNLIAFRLLLHGKKCQKAQRKQAHCHARGIPACR